MPASPDLGEVLGRPVLEVAPLLLGGVLRVEGHEGAVAIELTEVEAYDGSDDPGSHAHRGPTPRNRVMFGPPGALYTYLIYGMHVCANVVTGPSGRASAVLLRAGRVVEGLDLARARRGSAVAERDLCRGPARLCRALGISLEDNGASVHPADPAGGAGTDALEGDLRVTLALPAHAVPRTRVGTGPRVGLRQAGERPWRFWLTGDPTVSAYRPAKGL
ncbi:DNA-3-methyladenine glycosylase [Nocardioides sp.]|uniref:DNA-3-methyladenine glycosylase n=1 Tax=Nocardioides sp. TaxID=35761 RepID=UPI002735773C|nr:DNA-3-methyladenine glycosylase [Nocardioides sp.]MDP3893064.1 DNA-3-methyladenine glycosylase [Nocardioides sp.]